MSRAVLVALAILWTTIEATNAVSPTVRCKDVPAASDAPGSITVQLCEGASFHVRGMHPEAVVRGRVVGAAAVELVFAAGVASFNTPAGNYTVFIELQYARLDPEAIWDTSPVGVTLVEGFEFWHLSDTTNPAMLPCESGPAVFRGGHWVARVPPRYGRKAIGDGAPAAVFVPRNCTVPDVPTTELRGACFFGDSHMRHLHNEWSGALEATATESVTVRSVQVSNASAYVDDPYGECFAGNMPFGTTGRHASRVHTLLHWQSRCKPSLPCSVALVGFGQWFVSHAVRSPRAPRLTASAFAARAVQAMRSASASYPHAVWLTTHPLGEGWDSLYTQPPGEWRTDGVMRAYNDAAAQAVGGAGFTVYDVFGMANVLHDLSYDGSHYKAPVEREIARLVAHAALPRLSRVTV